MQRQYLTKSSIAYYYLIDRLTDGTIAPGQRIDIDPIAKATHMSRMPVRHALIRLTSEGFVVGKPHESAYAAPLNLVDMHDLYSARTLLEPLLARSAMPFVTHTAMAAIEQYANVTRSKVERHDVEGFLKADWDFHAALYDLSPMPTTLALAELLRTRSSRYIAKYLVSPEDLSESQNEHEELVRLIAGHNSDAVEALIRQHIGTGQEKLRRVLSGSRDGART